MALQEALHWAVGRGRSKVAIGIHDLDTVVPPFHYVASPRGRTFVPLDFTEELTLDGILEQHPKGRDYAKIVRDFPLFPLITDDEDHVCSFPPIINGERTRVTTGTKNILLDVTGTDQRAVNVAANIICTAMAEAWRNHRERGDQRRSFSRSRPDGTHGQRQGVLRPHRGRTDRLADGRAARKDAVWRTAWPGLGWVRVQVPCYRADIMHDWDLFEDVAISYGYENFAVEVPPTFSIGTEHPVNAIATKVRIILAGLGYLEMMPFTLTNERVLCDQWQRPRSPSTLHLMHPISEEYTVVRTDILPLLLEMLQVNRHRELPQRLFATGDALSDLRTTQRLAFVSTHPAADFSEAYAHADAVLRELGIAYSAEVSADAAFIEGRRADIVVAGEQKWAYLARSILPCSPRSNWNSR